MKGAILEKGEKYYTYISRVFNAIHNVQKDYNWLITNIEAYPASPQYRELLSNDYAWVTGEELTDMIGKEDFQWIWAVMSGFPKNIAKEEILQYPYPYADGYKGFWENPITIQHPLAVVEIVPWDSSLVLIMSNKHKIIEDFIASMPLSRDLEDYNNS